VWAATNPHSYKLTKAQYDSEARACAQRGARVVDRYPSVSNAGDIAKFKAAHSAGEVQDMYRNKGVAEEPVTAQLLSARGHKIVRRNAAVWWAPAGVEGTGTGTGTGGLLDAVAGSSEVAASLADVRPEPFVLLGEVDSVVAVPGSPTEGDSTRSIETLIPLEIKTRMAYCTPEVPPREVLQLQAYIAAMDAPYGLHVQRVVGQDTMRCTTVQRDAGLWNDEVLPGLRAFVTDVRRLMRGAPEDEELRRCVFAGGGVGTVAAGPSPLSNPVCAPPPPPQAAPGPLPDQLDTDDPYSSITVTVVGRKPHGGNALSVTTSVELVRPFGRPAFVLARKSDGCPVGSVTHVHSKHLDTFLGTGGRVVHAVMRSAPADLAKACTVEVTVQGPALAVQALLVAMGSPDHVEPAAMGTTDPLQPTAMGSGSPPCLTPPAGIVGLASPHCLTPPVHPPPRPPSMCPKVKKRPVAPPPPPTHGRLHGRPLQTVVTTTTTTIRAAAAAAVTTTTTITSDKKNKKVTCRDTKKKRGRSEVSPVPYQLRSLTPASRRVRPRRA
jgi:hypothetical protein